MNNGDLVTFDILGSIGIMSLSDPPANQLPEPAFIPIGQFNQWINQHEFKGLIIRGEGRNFSSGGDLGEIFRSAGDPARLATMMKDGHRLLDTIYNLDIPVIAAINRVCFGGGLEIALASHIRVASENALLAFPEVNQNLMPGLGGTVRLPGIAGLAASIVLVLGGDTISATEAKALGIIDYLAPKDLAYEFSLKLMQKMTVDRPVSVIRSIMQSLKNAAALSPEMAMLEETKLFCSLARDEAERQKREGN
jgi:enoyl-CoA hydratase/carnithine racemase